MTFSIAEAFEDETLALAGHSGTEFITSGADGMTFVAIVSGIALIEEHWMLTPGMYACLYPGSSIIAENARLMTVTSKGYGGVFSVGGPIENTGRLSYINGCSDTGLVQPLRRGDPCLNFLHFPQRIRQTTHTHPSNRVGIVMRGSGLCVCSEGCVEMEKGDIFIVEKNTEHAFHTGDDMMDIVAFHPDSMFGPTDERHQMLEATIIESRR